MRNRTALSIFLFLTSLPVAGQLNSPHQNPLTNKDSAAKTKDARSILDRAKASALGIKNSFQRGLVLDEIGAAEAKIGDVDAAVDTANQAYPNNMATLTEIGGELANSNDLAKARFIGPKLKGGGVSTVLAFISRRQAEKGNVDEAFRTAEKIEAPEVRVDALQWIAQQQAANGNYSGARKTMALASAVDPARASAPEDVDMMIADVQLTRGDIETARATVASMKSPETRSAAMIGFAEELWRKGDKPGAAAWLSDALRQLPTGPRYEFLRYFAIPIQVKLGQKENAMQAAGALSRDMRPKGYMAVAITCAEAKDTTCVDAAVERMKSTLSSEDKELSDFRMKLMVLNVTAALIDHDQLEAASRWIANVDQRVDNVSWKRDIEPEAQLQRVFMLAQQDRFDDARSLTLKMQPDSIDDIQRGTALRTIAVLQTRKAGIASSQSWAMALSDTDDRAYALLGIAQALLGIGEVKLPYSAIQIH